MGHVCILTPSPGVQGLDHQDPQFCDPNVPCWLMELRKSPQNSHVYIQVQNPISILNTSWSKVHLFVEWIIVIIIQGSRAIIGLCSQERCPLRQAVIGFIGMNRVRSTVCHIHKTGLILLSFFFWIFWWTHSHVLFWGHWYLCFRFMVTSPLGIKAIVFLSRLIRFQHCVIWALGYFYTSQGFICRNYKTRIASKRRDIALSQYDVTLLSLEFYQVCQVLIYFISIGQNLHKLVSQKDPWGSHRHFDQ